MKNNENIWIFKELNEHLISISSNIENYKFNEATKDIYKFTKNIFCDWYLEIIKINLNNETDVSIKEEIKVCASKVFQYILKLAHPFIPFMTDDIYVNYLKNKKFLIQDDWPTIISFKFLKDSNNEIENIIKLTTICRNIKANLKIEPKIILEVFYTSDDLTIENNKFLIDKLGRVNINKVKSSELENKNFIKFVNNIITLYINKLQIDNENLLSKNTSTLEEQLLNLENDIAILRKKVENDDFLKKAPKIVIDKFVKKMKHKLSLKDKILNQIKS